jgi:hypothetical protein
MLRTRSLIANLNEVPREWVFEYYLKLSEKLSGQDIKITSVFNPTEKNPSMFIYYAKSAGAYKFKDFSSQDRSGDGVTLVQMMFSLTTRGEAAHKIIEDYNQWMLNNKEDYSLREFKIRAKYKVTEFTARSWNTLDKNYWNKYKIGSKDLEYYNVQPLESYKMTKEEDGELKELVIKGQYIYGYFRNDGSLYKIYQPKVTDNKFIKVKEYIQGTDQLTYQKEYLVICSSLKDMMALRKLGYANVEQVAPDSENTLIGEHVITAYRHKYKNVCTLFDNDEAGIAAMKKYSDRYGMNYVHLEIEKDISDAIKEHGLDKIREAVTPLLRKALNI